MSAFPGVDYLDFDSVLNDEELLARGTARQFVDEQIIPVIDKRLDCPCQRGVGQVRGRTRAWLSRGKGHEGLQNTRRARQVVDARFRHIGTFVQRLRSACRECAPGCGRVAGAALVPHAGPLWYRVGSDRVGDGLL